MFRAIEFLLLYEGTDNSLPSCDSKPQGLLRLIADEVPFRFIQLMMDADGPTKGYTTVYEFFKRVAIQSVRFKKIAKKAKYFRASFGGSMFDEKQRNYHDRLVESTMQKEERYCIDHSLS